MLVLGSLATAVDWRFFLAGGVACAFSHGVVVPFDVIKTRIQIDSSLASKGAIDALGIILSIEGPRALTRGLGQTLSGYAVQGSLKYGLFEELKPIMRDIFENAPTLIPLVLAGALAELVGSTALTPFEAMRIQAVSNGGQDNAVKTGGNVIKDTGNIDIFRGLPAILAKQVPFTVVQLSTFELATAYLRSLPDIPEGFPISFSAALLAGVLSSISSQPGDTILSITNKSKKNQESTRLSVIQVAQQVLATNGVSGFFLGTQARLLHVCTMVVVQLLVYDSIKHFFGIVATGSH